MTFLLAAIFLQHWEAALHIWNITLIWWVRPVFWQGLISLGGFFKSVVKQSLVKIFLSTDYQSSCQKPHPAWLNGTAELIWKDSVIEIAYQPCQVCLSDETIIFVKENDCDPGKGAGEIQSCSWTDEMWNISGVPHWSRLLQRDRWADPEREQRERNAGSAQSERRGGRRWKARITKPCLERFYVNNIPRNNRPSPLSSVRPLWFFFSQSLAAKYILTLILWDFSMQCGGFLIIRHSQLGLPVGTFLVRVALMRIELRPDVKVTLGLVSLTGCCWVLEWFGAIVCAFHVIVEWKSVRVGFGCEESNLKKRELRFHFQTGTKCGSCPNWSLGSVKTDLDFHNWLLGN